MPDPEMLVGNLVSQLRHLRDEADKRKREIESQVGYGGLIDPDPSDYERGYADAMDVAFSLVAKAFTKLIGG